MCHQVFKTDVNRVLRLTFAKFILQKKMSKPLSNEKEHDVQRSTNMINTYTLQYSFTRNDEALDYTLEFIFVMCLYMIQALYVQELYERFC